MKKVVTATIKRTLSRERFGRVYALPEVVRKGVQSAVYREALQDLKKIRAVVSVLECMRVCNIGSGI